MKILFMPKKWIIIILVSIFAISSLFVVQAQTVSYQSVSVVIDAGHGARDGGAVGVSGSIEKELNLSYSLSLQNVLCENNISVGMTRVDDSPLYSVFSVNKKKDDLSKRVSIINSYSPDLYISIHMNSTSYSYRQGATVYYDPSNEQSKELATIIAATYYAILPNALLTPIAADYYMLTQPDANGVLIEVGFISNAEEEALLLTEEYRNTVSYATADAISLYLSMLKK